MQLFEFEDNALHFIFLVVQSRIFQSIKGRFNFWSGGLFLVLIEQFVNCIFDVIVVLFFNICSLRETKFLYVAFSYFRSGCYNKHFASKNQLPGLSISGALVENGLNWLSESAMAAFWTSIWLQLSRDSW